MTKKLSLQEKTIRRISRAAQPFEEEVLKRIGAVDGVIVEHPGGKFTMTPEAMVTILSRIKYRGALAER